MELRVRLGLNIQEVRRSKGLSKEDLAHHAGINRGYIGKIENTKHAASVDMIEKIARALAVDPVLLFKPRQPSKADT